MANEGLVEEYDIIKESERLICNPQEVGINWGSALVETQGGEE